jgi:hypothetical protein
MQDSNSTAAAVAATAAVAAVSATGYAVAAAAAVLLLLLLLGWNVVIEMIYLVQQEWRIQRKCSFQQLSCGL